MSRITPPRIAAAAVAALGLALAGCAEERAGGTPARGGDAVASFTARGNAILCDARHDLAGDVLGRVLSGDDPTADEAGDEVLPAYRSIRSGLAALEPPAADRAAVARIMDDLDAAIDAISARPGLLLSDADPFAPIDARMAAIGLDGCA